MLVVDVDEHEGRVLRRRLRESGSSGNGDPMPTLDQEIASDSVSHVGDEQRIHAIPPPADAQASLTPVRLSGATHLLREVLQLRKFVPHRDDLLAVVHVDRRRERSVGSDAAETSTAFHAGCSIHT